jgi:hypothetical protein
MLHRPFQFLALHAVVWMDWLSLLYFQPFQISTMDGFPHPLFKIVRVLFHAVRGVKRVSKPRVEKHDVRRKAW